jgi:phytoene desaturase
MAKVRCVIIGAGAGGCSLAVYLSRQGYDVTVLEKQEHPGGRCGQILKDGHRFDLGATLMLMPRLFRSIYADWGEHLEDYLQLKPLDPIYDIHFDRGAPFAFSSSLPVLQSQMEQLEKGSFDRWRSYFDLGCRQYRELVGRFLGRNFRHAWDYFHPVNAYYFLALQAHRNCFQYTRKFFRSPELQAAFTFQNIYVGQSPFATSAAYILLSAMELAQGGWYPLGGMHSVIANLVGLARRQGADFRFRAPVEKILIKNSRAVGVQLADGSELPADLVVANADLPYAYERLLPDAPAAARLRNLRYTCSAVVFHWGLNRSFPQLGHHNVFLSSDYRGGFDGIFRRGAFGEPPHFYLNRPSHTDPASAPAGQDSFSAIVPCAHLDPRNPQDWETLSRRARRAVLDRLAQAGLPDVEKSIKFEIAFTPATWAGTLNLTRGAVFGSLHHGLSQIGYMRPSNRHPRYRNLYFVGGSTHPGSGVPLALLSGRLTAERILQDRGLSRPFVRKVEV